MRPESWTSIARTSGLRAVPLKALAKTLSVMSVIAFSTPLAGCGGPSGETGRDGPIHPAGVETVAGPMDVGSGGVSVDGEGNIYLGDFGRSLNGPGDIGTKVVKVTPSGDTSTFFEGLNTGTGNVFDAAGNLYQSSLRSREVFKISPDGTGEVYATEGIAGPVGVVLDDGGTLYVANCFNNTIREVTPDRTSTEFAADSLLSCPNGITRADDGALYVANFNNGDILRVDEEGTVSRLVTLPGGNNGHLVFHDGVLYVADRGGHRIYRVTLEGDTQTVAGSGEPGNVDGPLDSARFFLPNDLEFDATGEILYVNEVVDTVAPPLGTAPSILRRVRLKPSGGS